jgi:oxygen-independent coproporphyrinogen-3 oxidase
MTWLGREAPRYTSYPAANHFTSRVGEADERQWLAAIGDGTTVSLYIHIPFCKELCWFCGCHTKATRRYGPLAKYVRVLLREIETLKRHIARPGKLVNIHFGGGSPSLLEAADMRAILEAIYAVFGEGPTGELAIELDPRTTTPENIALYGELGFNRVSIGIQDFDPLVQQAINRVQPYEMVASVMDQLRQSGIHHINGDLIYGLPHQNAERFRRTLEKTIALNPTRIALFSYAHLPQLKKHQRLIEMAALPSEMDKLALYIMACDLLAASGYVVIGIDHFAKADDPLAITFKNHGMRRNFQGYVTDTTDVLIGVGCSAISQFPEGYVQNSADAADYRERVEKNTLPAIRGWEFEGDDLARKQLIDDLMCFMSADLGGICRKFHLDEDYFRPELKTLKDRHYEGIVALGEGRISVTTPYRMAARAVAAVFDRYRSLAAARYSKVV